MSQSDRAAGWGFIRNGPRNNNDHEFMEWVGEHTHTEGSPIFNWPETNVVQAWNNSMRGRQNANVSH